jgi:hypothetical protein
MQVDRPIDWSGMKFVIAEELGETMDVIYHKLTIPSTSSDEGEIKEEFNEELFVVNHKYYDGVGGLTRLLEVKEDFHYSEMPAFKTAPTLGLWEKIKKLIGFIKLTKPSRIEWIKRKDTTGRASGHVMAFIKAEHAQALEAELKSKRETVSSRLFWALDKTVCTKLLRPGSERKWISPVNMRGAVKVSDPYGNVAASVIMNFSGEITPREIHQRFRDYFRDRLYMGSWLYTNMARFIGLWGTRKMARKIKDLGVGVYSNMGPWPPKTYVTNRVDDGEVIWGGVPPASQILPVSCGVIHWNDGLAISLMLHPSLDQSLEEAQALMIELLEKTDSGLSSRAIIRSISSEACDQKAYRLA